MQGDFEAFYLRHFKAIYRVCYAFMKNAADAEDCTEDAFVKAMSYCGTGGNCIRICGRSSLLLFRSQLIQFLRDFICLDIVYIAK